MSRLESEYRRKGTLTKLKDGIGLSGVVGYVAGAGVGAGVGGVGSTVLYLVQEGGSYIMNGAVSDAIIKAYDAGIKGAGLCALIGGVGGALLFMKGRDYILSKFGLKK
jgi:hypothetical protein